MGSSATLTTLRTRCVHDLNSRLETIAHDGKSEINQIQQSKDLPPIKVGKIVEVVMRCQQDANAAAAPHTQNVFEAMQSILDQRGIHTSARQFAQQHGIDTTRMLGSPSKETVTQQVQGLLGEGGGPQGGPAPPESPQAFGGAGSQELPPPAPPAAPPQTLAWGRIARTPTTPTACSTAPDPGWGRIAGTSDFDTARGDRQRPFQTRPGSIGQPGMNAPLSTQCVVNHRAAQRIWSIGPVGCTTAQRLHAGLRPWLEPGRTHVGGTQQCAASNRPGSAAGAGSTSGVGRPGFDGPGNCVCC